MEFKGKKAAVLGLGMEGRDLLKYLAPLGVELTGFDHKPIAQLEVESGPLPKIELKTGESYLKGGLTDFDYIFRSPGVKPDLKEIVKAEKEGARVLSATQLFFDLCPAKIIGVTGTKGKGTTATLICNILQQSGYNVFLVGNIGCPSLSLLSRLKSEDYVVYELSSFQLQGLKKSPHLAVVLFIVSEHQDYHANFAEYVQAKKNIVRFQKDSDFAVLNADNRTTASFKKITRAKTYFFSRFKPVNGAYIDNKRIKLFLDKQIDIGDTADLKIIGCHNWDNVAAASLAASLVGADLKSIRKAIFSFSGLEHRLELVKTLSGVKFYNDSFSTTPETAIAAIKSFEMPLILIVGGSDKGSDFTGLGQEIADSKVKLLILIGQMSEKIEKAVKKSGYKGGIIKNLKTMKQIVAAAFSAAADGDTVLLSPACASFDMFKNYKDRGNQFKAEVGALKHLDKCRKEEKK